MSLGSNYVSPLYGRRLSTSARGLLDCLAQLQLIEPAFRPGFDLKKDQHYEDVIATLQSLWLTEPRNTEKEEAMGAREAKGVGTEQVSPPRSSSGVGMSSGSGGSGKENGNPPGGEPTPSKTTKASLREDGAAGKVVEEEPSTVPPGLDSPKAPDPSSSDKSSATDTERETPDDYSSATPPTAPRAPMSKRPSQDPDPVWVLHLLKKLEKQFMSHYVSAMTEFKVRWDLDDSVVLNTMMGELRDELSRRIQSSVDCEVKKIQGRAGRGGRMPRPPQRGNLSRESTVTDNRRRILTVMKKQSLITAECLSDDDTPGEFSDQRSDDEYCPCDACVRKKMDARPFKPNPLASEAPVAMEFDLLKILQLRKDAAPATVHAQPAAGGGDSNVTDEEGRSLEVLQEEEEEEEEEEDQTKEGIKAHIVLEETIPEEDEELEKEEDGDEAEEKEEQSIASDEAGEEMSKNGDEEEEEAECHCQLDINEEGEEETAGEEAEEINDNTGEDETGEEDEREEEETTGRESGGEEASGETEDDNAGKREDVGEGNVSTSAEEEDDGDEESHEDEKGGGRWLHARGTGGSRRAGSPGRDGCRAHLGVTGVSCSPGRDGRACEGGAVSRRQRHLQEDLGGAASLHPGRAADGLRLNTRSHAASEQTRAAGVATERRRELLTPTAGVTRKASWRRARACILRTTPRKVKLQPGMRSSLRR
ncbi:Retinitis pigmentosa 1-like 1 protein [Liparis tanakae]|uniref:Retinitis pigmentosa 1-like 1 protein n=1 Tax=Liparis tanakae TaxID=230148 RepID=A0A4Z2G4A3_9TELE|nr:Retinitis pigmentosa 1-like 1 protein [Liparis tanakae]